MEDVFARSETEVARLARLIRDVSHGTIANVLATLTCSECRPEVVQRVAMSPEALARLEFNTPDTNAIIDRKNLRTDREIVRIVPKVNSNIVAPSTEIL